MPDLASVVPAPRFAATMAYYLLLHYSSKSDDKSNHHHQDMEPKEDFILKNNPAKVLHWVFLFICLLLKNPKIFASLCSSLGIESKTPGSISTRAA